MDSIEKVERVERVKRVERVESARDYLYSWNLVNKKQFAGVKIEEDIRDALQCVRTTRPSVEHRKQLVELSAKVGVQFAFLGFPAASEREAAECTALANHVAQRNLSVEPVFMARALSPDLLPILEIRDRTGIAITADIFISTSALRLKVEGWTLAAVIEKMQEAAHFAKAHALPFRISLEDSTRTAPDALALAVGEAVDLGAKAIVLCDTVGDCLPSGASRTTAFVREQIERASSNVEIGWHGHNDKGLALANAIAAIESGASIISGTFMGIGERTGNIPLEQLILMLSEAGNDQYDLHAMMRLCELFSESANISTPHHLPLIGRDAFSTATGTHVAAIHKARQFGPDFEDLIYSAVSANALGRGQTLLIGPNSGRGSIQAILVALNASPTEELISAVLHHCKQQDRCLEGADDVLELVATLAGQPSEVAVASRHPEHAVSSTVE